MKRPLQFSKSMKKFMNEMEKQILTHKKIVWIDALFCKSAKGQDDHEIAIVTKSVRIIDRRFAD